jgi:hypothetical protein
LYLATRSATAPLGELLRHYGVHLDDLRAIERTVEQAALAELKGYGHHGGPPTDFSPARVQYLKQELAVPSAVAATQGLHPRPYNALTAREAALVVALIQSPLHADASCREPALALEQGPAPLYVSHVTIWEYQCALNCNGLRGRQTSQGLHRTAPDTDWVNGPNQLWDWDITYLHSPERGVFFYLYSLLDHWSRKNIAWLIGTQLSSACVQTLWDHGLITEHPLDQPASTWPKSLNDRGAQMRCMPDKARACWRTERR